MTNSKSTKRALLTSALAMLMCVAMLIGTTFAWFTDTASTAVNKIQAGNLDVKLEYLDGEDWKEVTNETKLFNDEALWEPGYTEIAYLKVSNVGSLALKYKFAVNKIEEVIGVNAAGGEIKLSEILKFGIAASDSAQTYADRAAARGAVDGKELTLNSYTNDIHLGVNESKYYAIVIYMPETVGNEANYATGTTAPSIKMGLNLVATQDTVESDSYGYDYDQNAYKAEGYTVTAVTPVETKIKALKTNIVTEIVDSVLTAKETVSGEQNVTAGGISVTYPANTVLATTPAAASEESTVASTQDAQQGFVEKETAIQHSVSVGDGENATVFELTLPVSQNNTTLVKVENTIASDLSVERVLHSGTGIAKATSKSATPSEESYYYDSTDGTFILWVYHASEIATVTKNKAPVFSMFPEVNVTIISDIVGSGETVLNDATSKTTAVIPAAAVEEGIVKAGQKIYLVIKTTNLDGNEATYDISLRDANGNPFAWTTDACPSVTYDMGKYMGNYANMTIYDSAAGIYLPYGENAAPGWYYNSDTGLTTIRSISFS